MLVIVDEQGNRTEVKNDVITSTVASIVLSVLINAARPVRNIVISVNGTPFNATARVETQNGGTLTTFTATVTFESNVQQISASLSINSMLIAEAAADVNLIAGQYTFIWMIAFGDQTGIVTYAFAYWATNQIKSVSISSNGNSVMVTVYANTITFFIQYVPNSAFSNSYPDIATVTVTFNLTDGTSVTGTIYGYMTKLFRDMSEPIALVALSLILAP